MQILTGQYPTMYTHKFRVSYTDLQQASVKYKNFKLFDLNAGYQVLWSQMRTSINFMAPSLGTLQFRLHSSNTLPAADTANGSYNNYAPSGTTAWAGSFQSAQSRIATVAGLLRPVTGNVIDAYSIYLSVNITGTSFLAALTAGSVDVWVCVVKVP